MEGFIRFVARETLLFFDVRLGEKEKKKKKRKKERNYQKGGDLIDDLLVVYQTGRIDDVM